MNDFILFPIFVRAAVILAVPLLLWFVLGRMLLWCLSLIPYLVRQIFRLLYKLLQIPIAALHQKLGGNFYKIDNGFSQTCGKIDAIYDGWYRAWHNPEKGYRGIAVIIYLICVIIIGTSSQLKVYIPFLNSVETVYFACEDFIVEWVEERGWFETEIETGSVQELEKEKLSDTGYSEIILTVSGVKTALKVRDLPTMETDVVLDRIHNGDKIVWNGQLAFSKKENGIVELWAKIITPNGIEGWSRMSYLLPEEYENAAFYVAEEK